MRLMVTGVFAAMLVGAGAHAQDSTGIPECDAFIAAYRSCVASPNVPAAVKPGMLSSLDGMSTSYKQAASNPTTRQTMVQQCVQAHQSTRQSMTQAFKCDFPAPK